MDSSSRIIIIISIQDTKSEARLVQAGIVVPLKWLKS